MLVLKRKKNEALLIGSDIEIVVADIKGDTVKIGIRAPKEVSVYRKEIYETILEANKSASNFDTDSLDNALQAVEKKKKLKKD